MGYLKKYEYSGSWDAAQTGFGLMTVRYIIPAADMETSTWTGPIYIKFGQFGAASYKIHSAYIGLRDTLFNFDGGQQHVLFSTSSFVVVPIGGVTSDAVTLNNAGSDIIVSVYFGDPSAASYPVDTASDTGTTTTCYKSGDYSSDTTITAYTPYDDDLVLIEWIAVSDTTPEITLSEGVSAGETFSAFGPITMLESMAMDDTFDLLPETPSYGGGGFDGGSEDSCQNDTWTAEKIFGETNTTLTESSGVGDTWTAENYSEFVAQNAPEISHTYTVDVVEEKAGSRNTYSVESIQVRKHANGNEFASVTMSDTSPESYLAPLASTSGSTWIEISGIETASSQDGASTTITGVLTSVIMDKVIKKYNAETSSYKLTLEGHLTPLLPYVWDLASGRTPLLPTAAVGHAEWENEELTRLVLKNYVDGISCRDTVTYNGDTLQIGSINIRIDRSGIQMDLTRNQV